MRGSADPVKIKTVPEEGGMARRLWVTEKERDCKVMLCVLLNDR